MRAKKGTRMAAATELLFVYGLDGSIAMVTGPKLTHKKKQQSHKLIAFF